MEFIDNLKRKWRYRKTWGTPIGQDCISLDTSLCRWLGERLLFLSEHCLSWDPNLCNSHADYKATLKHHGDNLLGWCDHYNLTTSAEENEAYERAQHSLRWVTDNLCTLWD